MPRWAKEKSYDRGNKGPLGPTPPPRNAHNPRRAASARRPLRLRLEKEDNPRSPTGSPRLSSSGRSHEITPELDADWTLSDDWAKELLQAKELRYREVSNEVIKEQLQLGMPVIYRSLGWSLYPRIWPNDECTYEPVTSADDVNENDIVFCQVQPSDHFYGHLVSRRWF